MAIIHPTPPAVFRSSRASASAPPTTPQIPHTLLAHAFTKHIIHIFGSARYPYPSVRSMWQATLPVFITSILYGSRLPVEVGLSAMVLLLRYKDAVPHSVAYGDDAARLFLAAYIVAAKVMSDADLEPKGEVARREQTTRRGMDFWFRISQRQFPIEELRRMELELCRILRWNVQVSPGTFARFQRVVYEECGMGDEALEETDEEEMEEERLRQEHIERPPPPYCEVERDARVVEIVHEGYTGARRGTWQEEITSTPQYQAQALIPSPYGVSHEDDEHRRRLGRMIETALSPMSIGVIQEDGRGDIEGKEKGFIAVVKERILQTILRKPTLPNDI